MQLSLEQVYAIQTWAHNEPYIREVYLFGSRAKDSAQMDSDADIAIVIDVEDHEIERFFIFSGEHWQKDLSDRTGLKVSLAHLAGPRTPIHTAAVEDHGIKLYPIHP